MMQALSGNPSAGSGHRNSDKESFRNMFVDFTEQMRVDFGIEPFDYAQGNYLIADSALYTAETLSSMSTLLWISRVPETLNLACDVIDVAVPEPVEGLRPA